MRGRKEHDPPIVLFDVKRPRREHCYTPVDLAMREQERIPEVERGGIQK